jgi:hypothetical protein
MELFVTTVRTHTEELVQIGYRLRDGDVDGEEES